MKALRAQRLELYSLSRHHQIGDDVLREVLGELDLSEAKLGQVKQHLALSGGAVICGAG